MIKEVNGEENESKKNNMKTPKEYLENKGIDTDQIVAYFVRDGIGDEIDIDIEELISDYFFQAIKERDKQWIEMLKVEVPIIEF